MATSIALILDLLARGPVFGEDLHGCVAGSTSKEFKIRRSLKIRKTIVSDSIWDLNDVVVYLRNSSYI